jgi:hypothetical protein
MSYLDEKYDEWYNVIGGPAVYKVVQTWQGYNPGWDHTYYATEYEDGWFSVDGEEWFGEFQSRQDAETYLGLVFSKTDVYGGES